MDLSKQSGNGLMPSELKLIGGLLRRYVQRSQTLVLISLFLQIILAIFGRRRQRSKSKRLYFILWSAYLWADSVAITGLSILAAEKSNPYDAYNKGPNFVAFWSPFLLLHLGGPDAMTALSLEDNNLWWRHCLGLIIHTGMTLFILLSSFTIECSHHSCHPDFLLILSIPIFLVGFVKYAERILSLMSASFPQRRYSDFMFPTISEYQSHLAQWPPGRSLQEKRYQGIICDAHYLFQIFKRVFVNLSISQPTHEFSKDLFRNKDWREIFKVIEIELQIMFDVLYTKALSRRHRWRFSIKVASCCMIFPVFMIFLFKFKRGHKNDEFVETDILITYILLVGALLLEIYQGIILFRNDWTFIVLLKMKYDSLRSLVYKVIPSSQIDLLHEPSRWSNSMGQCNLLSDCFRSTDVKTQKVPFIKMKRLLWIRDTLEKFWRISVAYQRIEYELKEAILKHLWERVSAWEGEVRVQRIKNLVHMGISMDDLFRSFLNRWGGWVLEKHKCQKTYGWTTTPEIDYSILVWHIATDICYYFHFGSSTSTSTSTSSSTFNQATINCSLSKNLSDYMFYLLVKHPTIVTSNLVPEKRFKEAREALREALVGDCTQMKDEAEACAKLYEDGNDHGKKIDCCCFDLKEGETSIKSVIQAARVVAKSLMSESPKKRWQIIISMWLDMLVYVANQCPGDSHAARLTHGGELITHVWLLMTHLGISTPCEPATRNNGTRDYPLRSPNRKECC